MFETMESRSESCLGFGVIEGSHRSNRILDSAVALRRYVVELYRFLLPLMFFTVQRELYAQLRESLTAACLKAGVDPPHPPPHPSAFLNQGAH